MRAGTLRERVVIQASVPATDSEWGRVEQWQDVAETWANVKPAGGGESVKDQGVQSSLGYKVRIRFRSGVTSANRLVWRGRVLDIVSAVDPDARRRELLITAKEPETTNG